MEQEEGEEGMTSSEMAKFCSMLTAAVVNFFDPEAIRQRKLIEQEREHCDHVEWERDCNATIPVCKMLHQPCSAQCIQGRSCCPCENPLDSLSEAELFEPMKHFQD